MGSHPSTPHVLTGLDQGAKVLSAIAQRALDLRAGSPPRRFDGLTLGAVFFNPSLRTRTSLESACVALGIHPIILEPGSASWGWEIADGVVMDGDKPEHIREAVPVLSSYVDLLAVRAFAGLIDAEEDRRDPILSAFAALSSRPVINLESARYHPLQGFADAATWQSRFGPDLTGRRLTLSWAPHPKALPAAVPNQVLLTAAALGMEVTVAHPEGFELDPEIVEAAEGLAATGGGGVQISHDPDAPTQSGAEVVYAKSWSGFSGYGRRDEEALARQALAHWTVTPDRLGDAGFMHCLPVRRNVVVTDAVMDGPANWSQEQAAFRRWTSMSALEHVCGQMGGAGWIG